MVSWAEGQLMAVKPVAEVTVLPKPGESAARGNLWSAARVEADAGALVWPQMCCCCGSATDLDSIGIYSLRTVWKHTRTHSHPLLPQVQIALPGGEREGIRIRRVGLRHWVHYCLPRVPLRNAE